MSDTRSVLRIGEVSRRTLVAVPTLRAWERRYGLLTPARTNGGHRLYSSADVERVQGMQRLLGEGWSAAAAAREMLRDPAAVATVVPLHGTGGGHGTTLAERLIAAIERFDVAACDEVVDDAFSRYEVARALDEVVVPVLQRLGDGDRDEPIDVARHHFASTALRPRLQRLLRTGGHAAARGCLAATAEGEQHDLTLLCAAVALAQAGWRVHDLGVQVPTAALEAAAADLDPDLVLVGATLREQAASFLADRPVLGRAALVLEGGGFIPSDVSRAPGAVVHEGAVRDVPATAERAVAARGVASGSS